jgi:RNA polymerase sigma-70 factor (ECF subfamily)
MSDASLEKALSATALSGRALSRERRGFLDDIYQDYWPELCRYINKTFGAGPPDPEDIVQQAFVNFAMHENSHGIANPRAYLYRTARNIAVDHERRVQRHNRLQRLACPAPDEEFTDDFDPERVLMGRGELKILEAAINSLSDRDRTFFLLNRLEGLSFAEIARRTGMSASGVRLIVERSLQTCQEAMRVAEVPKRSRTGE